MPFSTFLLEAEEEPDVSFFCFPATGRRDVSGLTPVYKREFRSLGKGATFILHRFKGYDVLHFSDINADFYIEDRKITCYLSDPEVDLTLMELHLLGVVFSYWLECRGIVVLHASSVVAGDRAVVFLNSSRGSKSVIAATLLEKGLLLLSDDMLPVEFTEGRVMARPSYPQMRLWPEDARRFIRNAKKCKIVHPLYPKCRIFVGQEFGSFCNSIRPVECIYLPEMMSDSKGIEIVDCSKREAFVELIGNSYIAKILQVEKLYKQRMQLLAEIVRNVPFRKIRYPAGFSQLPSLSEAILDSISSG